MGVQPMAPDGFKQTGSLERPQLAGLRWGLEITLVQLCMPRHSSLTSPCPGLMGTLCPRMSAPHTDRQAYSEILPCDHLPWCPAQHGLLPRDSLGLCPRALPRGIFQR